MIKNEPQIEYHASMVKIENYEEFWRECKSKTLIFFIFLQNARDEKFKMMNAKNIDKRVTKWMIFFMKNSEIMCRRKEKNDFIGKAKEWFSMKRGRKT